MTDDELWRHLRAAHESLSPDNESIPALNEELDRRRVRELLQVRKLQDAIQTSDNVVVKDCTYERESLPEELGQMTKLKLQLADEAGKLLVEEMIHTDEPEALVEEVRDAPLRDTWAFQFCQGCKGWWPEDQMNTTMVPWLCPECAKMP